ncbi:MAG: hypothetical protein A3I78_09700 [Gammaproteobacteria bacterium RIFCSPLOWO2_02_FULL_56_15]|nr:MAG: hypothetical protein A3I78_09700 [Gammaproteobacteria bacterium RIFCSPLOWO2_02_FULL_56_15]
MDYVFICEDVDNSLDGRTAHRPAHLARLQALQEEGRLLLAGPFPAIDNPDPGPAGYSGSLIIAEFRSLEEAEGWAAEEPFLKAGVYRQVTVKPFRQTLP